MANAGRDHDGMAKTTITHVTDDLDGSKDATEVAFSFGGVDYTIDLNKKNLAAFEKVMKPYVDVATKVSGRGSRSARKKSPATSSAGAAGRKDLGEIREWARANGVEVSDRGRVAASVIEQFDAAQRA